MSEYYAKVSWKKDDEEAFVDNKYSRAHQWHFDGGSIVNASSSPHIVPLPYSVEEHVDPEEAFIASLSSCHMLFFLSIAVKRKLVVNSYVDNAVGVMEKDLHGHVAITEVTLQPQVVFGENSQTTRQQLEKMHHQAHQQCFIANSVKTKVSTKIID